MLMALLPSGCTISLVRAQAAEDARGCYYNWLKLRSKVGEKIFFVPALYVFQGVLTAQAILLPMFYFKGP